MKFNNQINGNNANARIWKEAHSHQYHRSHSVRKWKCQWDPPGNIYIYICIIFCRALQFHVGCVHSENAFLKIVIVEHIRIDKTHVPRLCIYGNPIRIAKNTKWVNAILLLTNGCKVHCGYMRTCKFVVKKHAYQSKHFCYLWSLTIRVDPINGCTITLQTHLTTCLPLSKPCVKYWVINDSSEGSYGRFKRKLDITFAMWCTKQML